MGACSLELRLTGKQQGVFLEKLPVGRRPSSTSSTQMPPFLRRMQGFSFHVLFRANTPHFSYATVAPL
jgi:hypothetical protein